MEIDYNHKMYLFTLVHVIPKYEKEKCYEEETGAKTGCFFTGNNDDIVGIVCKCIRAGSGSHRFEHTDELG